MKLTETVGKVRSRLWTKVLVAGLVLFALLEGSRLVSGGLTNAAVLALRDGLMGHDDLVLGTYPHYDLLSDGLPATWGAKSLRWAQDFDGGNLTARWALGRLALAVGDGEAAVSALRPLTTQATRHPLLYRDVLTTMSRAARPDDVISLYEGCPPPERTQAISDTVALAYLEQQGRGEEQSLKGARALRPGDLFVNYHLWKQALDAGEAELVALYSQTLTYFPLEAVGPTDERLLGYAVQVIPELLDKGIWDLQKTVTAVSYLVWQHGEAAAVENLLQSLLAGRSTDADWAFYLGELYHRRGDLQQAERAYERALAVEPQYAQAYVRLGMLAQERGMLRKDDRATAILAEAAAWYGRYHHLAPECLLGLTRLAEVCRALEPTGVEGESCWAAAERLTEAGAERTTPGRVLTEALAERTDDRRVAAELLGVRVEDVQLGPNLVENGGFEVWDESGPKGWGWSAMFSRKPFNRAVFVGGNDTLLSLKGELAARVDGLWVEARDDQSAARGGFWLRDEVDLQADTAYLVSLDYRTAAVSGARSATLWVGGDEDFLWGHDHLLSRTDGEWRHFAAVSGHRSKENTGIRPLVRSFATGSVMFDNVTVREVTLVGGLEASQVETRFWSHPAD